MSADDDKAMLQRYLGRGRAAVLWKLDGLSEYDVRRPLVPTGTNLLGLVKHLSGIEAGYFGECLGRPFAEDLYWMSEDAEDNADMWATADESRADIVDLYGRACAHADATIAALGLDAPGEVPWWPKTERVTLHRLLVHVIAETDRHAGQMDIVRELVDGAAGVSEGNSNLPPGDPAWWRDYHDRLEAVAAGFRATP